ncbi:hypothetical protein AJ87_26870 [Rhizobium yanglingense]|nr:hypothetical protein AJ87_26870 [Rhizobium yanglingense]
MDSPRGHGAVLVLAQVALGLDARQQVLRRRRLAGVFHRHRNHQAVFEDDAVIADVFAQNSVRIAVQKHGILGVDRLHVLAKPKVRGDTTLEIALVIENGVAED